MIDVAVPANIKGFTLEQINHDWTNCIHRYWKYGKPNGWKLN
jgi:hypothetical protein